MVKPWLENGHACTIVDINHPPGVTIDGNLRRVGADINTWQMDDKYDLAFAFPPCTDIASSGARWFAQKGQARLDRAIEFVLKCWHMMLENSAECMLENPIGRLSTEWQKPHFVFDPCAYGGYLSPPGDAYTKATCLWLSTGFVIPPTKWVEPTEGSKMHKMSPGFARSITPLGFAYAVYEANK